MKIYNIDASILITVQNCARKAQYSHVYSIQPYEKDDALQNGDLMHKMLEPYYSMKLDNGPNLESDVWKELQENGVYPSGDPVKVGVDSGLYFASKMSIPSDTAQEVITQFEAYCEYYKHEEWHPLHVEEVGSLVLHEDEDLKIIYDFKIDLIADRKSVV